MLKQIGKTVVLGLASGVACAAGTWLWKNCAEGKVDELKKKNDDQKKEKSETKEVE